MSGRSSRAKLLMPSFVVVASASACWSSRLDDDPPYNPPNPNPTASCPSSAPSNGASCESEGQECDYGASACGAVSRVRCSNGAWLQSVVSCNPPPPPFCPPEVPVGVCYHVGFSCAYLVPDCGSVKVVCGTDHVWFTETQCTPSCPTEPPIADSACLGDLSCIYGDCDEASHAMIASCGGGIWQLFEAACPPEGGGGAGGEAQTGGEGGAAGDGISGGGVGGDG